jgi:hypothetical protein
VWIAKVRDHRPLQSWVRHCVKVFVSNCVFFMCDGCSFSCNDQNLVHDAVVIHSRIKKLERDIYIWLTAAEHIIFVQSLAVLRHPFELDV